MAFSDLNLQDYHLVIAGDSDHKTSYSNLSKRISSKKASYIDWNGKR